MAAPAAKLLIDIAANVAGLRKDFNEAAGVVQGFGAQVQRVGQLIKATLGALSLGQVLAFAERIAHDAAAMSDMADNLKLTVDEFQAFNNAAYLAGQSAETVATALGKFNVFIGKAAEGSKEQIERLNELGVKVLDVGGKLRPQADLLQEVAQKILGIADPARRAAMEVAFFGKSGQQVSAILDQWAKGQERLNLELEKAGLRLAPEVIKQLDELADSSDRAQKRFEVFVAPFYALAKSKVLEIVVGGIENLTTAISLIPDAKLQNLAALAAMFALNPGGLIGSIVGPNATNATTQLVDQISAIDKELTKLNADLVRFKAGGPNVWAGDIGLTTAKIQTLLTQRAQLEERAGIQVLPTASVVASKGGVGQPAIAGVDKYAESLKKLQAELDASNAGIKELEASTNLPSKEAERQAKATAEAGKRLAAALHDLPAGIDTKKIVELNEKLKESKLRFDEMVKTQATADEVNSKYADGQKELTDRMFYLNKAYADGKIGLVEYTAASDDARKAAEKQQLVHDGLTEGVGGLAAGFKYAAKQMEESQTSFQIGQQLFSDSFRLMSSAISEFVKTGQLDFGKLAQSFSAMLTNMAAEWAARQVLRFALKALGFGTGGGDVAGGSGTLYSLPAPAPPAASGMLAGGGDVMAGRYYTVGEGGPERFYPKVPGTVVPTAASSPSVAVNVDMSGGPAPSARQAAAFARRMKQAVLDTINDEKRPGGTLYAGAR